jgi:outer membrane protein assembly factor BamA
VNRELVFSRIFKPGETKTIRIYGIAGEDKYSMIGNSQTIKIVIIGGRDKDSIIQQGQSRIHIYDDRNNSFQTDRARLHLSSDSTVHAFDYFDHHHNKKGFKPSAYYNDEDRIYIGLGYGFTNYKWRRSPFATQQSIDLHYSLCQNACSLTYQALFPNLIGRKWNVFWSANYDAVRWANFFGLGNETSLTDYSKDYFRLRTIEWLANVGVSRQLGKSTFAISGFFQSVKIIADTGKYLTKVFLPLENDAFEPNDYAGALLNYTYLELNDSILPTRGITFSVNASFFSNTSRKEFFQKYFGRLQVYLPMGNKFSLAVKAGGATVRCKPAVLNSAEFYEHAIIGGPETLRGFRLDRFWGQSSFYNNNELRFITRMNTRLMNAKIGCLLFFDDGRVWMPDENSNMLHTSYGGGIIFAPLYKMAATLTYGISKEARIFQVSLNRLF